MYDQTTDDPRPLSAEIDRFVSDLGGWPDEGVERRRRERVEALIEQALDAERARHAALVAALEDTTRLLEYLWSATGNNAPDMPVADLFTDGDPIVDDILTTLGRARMVLHGATPAPRAALDGEPR